MRHTVWLMAALLAAASCNKAQQETETAAQKTFASPEDAGAALVAAAKSGDGSALTEIFGPDSKAALLTGDASVDKASLNDFVTAYNQMHRWREIKAGGEVLQVGADNYPFPIPLGRNPEGRWYFDTAAGKDEILARRIGKNELTAMDASKAIAGAERQYFQKEKHYTQKFVSDPGKQNGLYWPAEGQTPSPLGRLGDFAGAAIAGSSPEFNGYRYRILSDGGKGFAVLAYPAEYRNSGIMSFLVGEDGTVYQKDLGEHTADAAEAITEYNPADGWTAASGSNTRASRAQQ